MTQFITCPECSHEIHIEEALAKRIESSMKAELATRSQALDQRELALNEARIKQELQIVEQLQQREAQFRAELRTQLDAERQQEDRERERELEAKTQRIKDLLGNEAELRRQKRELEEAKASVDAEVEKRLSDMKSTLEQTAHDKAQAETGMILKEKEILIQQLKNQVTDMNRKMEQGSMQVQGEAQELALEQLLRESHTADAFEEIRKGDLGADLAQWVRSPFGKDCGVILYESKRTKAFSEEWVSKLKHDMQLRKADIGVIVTRTRPKGVTQFELRDSNIYICTFEEVKALSYCLRATLIKVDEVRVVQANKGDKSRLLYDYLMGQEFKNQLQLIHSVFQRMHTSLVKEKQSTVRRLKQREKELDQVLMSFSDIVGSLNGIAGHTEFEDFEVLYDEPALIG